MEFVRSRLAVSAENVRYESGYARTEATSGGEGLQAETRKYAFAYLKQMHVSQARSGFLSGGPIEFKLRIFSSMRRTERYSLRKCGCKCGVEGW